MERDREMEREREKVGRRRNIYFLSFPKASRVSTFWTSVNNDITREVYNKDKPTP